MILRKRVASPLTSCAFCEPNMFRPIQPRGPHSKLRRREPFLSRRPISTWAALVIGSTCVFAQSLTPTPPNNDWEVATPEQAGLDSAALAEMFDAVRERDIPVHSVQIVRHGRLVLDAYFYPYHS